MPEVSIYCHQDVRELSPDLLTRIESAANTAVPLVLDVEKVTQSSLRNLDEVEVSFIDDETIADVHLEFMDIPGATDVITFDHGEIHISVETAQEQATQFGNDFERELMLYVIHGLLHLAGYEDATEPDRLKMDDLQQAILTQVWGE